MKLQTVMCCHVLEAELVQARDDWCRATTPRATVSERCDSPFSSVLKSRSPSTTTPSSFLASNVKLNAISSFHDNYKEFQIGTPTKILDLTCVVRHCSEQETAARSTEKKWNEVRKGKSQQNCLPRITIPHSRQRLIKFSHALATTASVHDAMSSTGRAFNFRTRRFSCCGLLLATHSLKFLHAASTCHKFTYKSNRASAWEVSSTPFRIPAVSNFIMTIARLHCTTERAKEYCAW